jgi:xanthine dehydrogenase YagS FAD-binding subunit
VRGQLDCGDQLAVLERRLDMGRIALGGVGTRPWRAHAAEAALRGQALDEQACARAAEAAVEGAVARPGNAFKVELARRTVQHTLAQVGALA